MVRHCVTGDISERERGLLCFMAARDIRRDRIGCEAGSPDACGTLAEMVEDQAQAVLFGPEHG